MMNDALPLKPLQASFEENALEADLKALFIRLYQESLAEQDDEINTYGMPHLGTLTLLQRHIKADGLAVINNGETEKIRFLFKAWKHQNPRRGLHFLRTYLRVLWGDAAEAQQMYQKKSLPYPTHLRSLREIEGLGESVDDYYLTTRVRVDVDTGDALQENIRAAVRSTLAARLVLDMRVAKFAVTEMGIGMAISIPCFVRLEGEMQRPSLSFNGKWGFDSTQEYDGILNNTNELTFDGSWLLDGSQLLDGIKR